MNLKKELRELVEIRGKTPIISLYLNTYWKGKGERSRARIFVKKNLSEIERRVRKETTIKDEITADINRIKEYFDALLHGSIYSEFSGMALFLSSIEGIFKVYHSSIPFDNEFHFDPYPHLRQLIRLLDEYEHALSVVIDSKSARILEITLGGLVKEEEISNYVPGRHTAGGWSQMRFQRHIKDHMDRHHSEVAELVARLVNEEDIKNIIVFGQERAVNNLVNLLPDRVRRMIITTEALEIDANTDEIIELSIDILQNNERKKEAKMVGELIEEAGRGGSACLGIGSVIEAVNKGQIYRLLVDREYTVEGYRCMNCNRLYHEVHLECPFCKGRVEKTDLIESLLHEVIKQEGIVESVKEDIRLKEVGKIGAFYRFR